MSDGATNAGDGERADCPTVAQLQAFTDGHLSLAELKAVSTHLLRCPKCETKLSSIFDEADRSRRTATMGKESKTPGRVLDSADSPVGMALVESSAPGGAKPKPGDWGLEPTMPLQLGQYRLIRQIGRGGMGVVYKAWHERLRREVAVKFLPVEQTNDPIGIERMQREMAATGTLRHPNVVYATDAGEAEGVHYLVMEYVAGIDLARLVARLGPLPVADACEAARQAALGLEHIRTQGMVHRDLKPSNLMLSTDGTIKVLDLGLARLRPEEVDEEQITRKNYVLGTADYVAPEQADDAHAADIRSDIYSLGCTLYKLLTGEPLYGGGKFDTWTRKVEAHRSAPLPELGGPQEKIPPELQQVLRKALAKSVRDRYQTPGDFAKALSPFAKGHHLLSLLRQVDLVPEPTTLPPETPSISSALLETADRPPMGPTTQFRGRMSRLQLLIATTVILTGLGGAIGLFMVLPDGKTPTVSDAREIEINTVRGLSTVDIDPVKKTITVNANDSRQLVSLGKLRAKPKRFAVTIEQPKLNWTGETGIFWGYRDEPYRENSPKKLSAATAQFIFLSRIEDQHKREEPKLRWSRGLAQIHPQSQSFNLLSGGWAVSSPIPANPPQIRLEIEFNDQGIGSFRVNGLEVPELSNPEVNQLFKPRDYEGRIGIFNYGNNDSSFSDIDFTSLEKE